MAPKQSDRFAQNTERSTKLAARLLQYRLPILSGLLIGTSYIPFPPWALFFCVTPLLCFWVGHAKNKSQVFWAGWLTQFILNLIGFHWIWYLTVEFGHFPVYGGILAMIGFAAIAHLYYPASGLLAFWLIRKFKVGIEWQVFVYVFSLALCEAVFWSVFPWHLGYPWLWAKWPGAQVADLIGFEGLNVLTLLVNGLVASSVLSGLFSKNRRAWLSLSAAALLIVIPNLAGLGREKPWQKTDSEISILAVQPNIGNFEKFMVELQSHFREPIVDKMLSLSREGLRQHPESQLLVWSETAFPDALDSGYLSRPLQARVRSLLTRAKVPILTGGYSRGEGGRDDYYNGLFFLDQNGNEPFPAYRKTILLVFGETFPFSDVIPYMDKFFPDQGNFARGSGPVVWPLKLANLEVSVGPQICYEGLYPWFAAQLARDGAEIFVNVTNDSWFWAPFEPNQHLYMTLARAIEFRRPMIRSTNTGITTAITAAGEVMQKSPIGSEWTGEFKLPFIKSPEHTFYERHHAAWPWILLASLVLILAFGRGSALSSKNGRTRSTPPRP